MKVGFIGLGAMGRAMALQLVKAGHAVSVWNRTAKTAEPLLQQGACWVADPVILAQEVEVLHSMLADDQAVRAVFELEGMSAALAGKVHVNHATISVALTRELAASHAKQRISYLAAPVFGRIDVAAAGRLNILAAGPAEALAKVRPLLEMMSSKVWPLGEKPEHAAVGKIAGNFMLASSIEMMAEASALTQAYGLPAGEFLEVMTRTLFAAPAFQAYAKLIAESRYEPADFALQLGYKDVGLSLAAGEAERVPLPMASLLRDNMLEAFAAGHGAKDWSVLAKVALRRAYRDAS